MISEHDIAALKEMTADFLRIVLGIFDLRRSFPCPNPEHDDGDPSAHYYPDRHSVHCFGCGGDWDVFALAGMVFGVPGFREQVEAVARVLGYHLDDSPEGRPAPLRVKTVEVKPMFEKPREAGGADCGDACGEAFDNLYKPGFEFAREYLRSRGIDDEDAARFGLGATKRPRDIMREFRWKEPEALGFITIPYWNADCSEANYCVLRTVSCGHVNRKEWRPAGVSSPLWREWMLSAALDCVYVTEGMIDAIALSKICKDKHVMALGGTSNARRFSQVLYHTPRELRPKKVVICMDVDDAGRKAAIQLIEDLARMRVPYGKLPEYPGGAKDADDWLMAGFGRDWEYEAMGVVLNDRTLYRTRWRDGS